MLVPVMLGDGRQCAHGALGNAARRPVLAAERRGLDLGEPRDDVVLELVDDVVERAPAGFAGQLLSVKPILTFEDGEVAPLKRVRGRTKALAELARIFAEATRDEPSLHVGVAHADAARDAEDLADRVRALRPHASLDLVTVLGPVIGTHGGPGTLGLFWYHDEL